MEEDLIVFASRSVAGSSHHGGSSGERTHLFSGRSRASSNNNNYNDSKKDGAAENRDEDDPPAVARRVVEGESSDETRRGSGWFHAHLFARFDVSRIGDGRGRDGSARSSLLNESVLQGFFARFFNLVHISRRKCDGNGSGFRSAVRVRGKAAGDRERGGDTRKDDFIGLNVSYDENIASTRNGDSDLRDVRKSNPAKSGQIASEGGARRGRRTVAGRRSRSSRSIRTRRERTHNRWGYRPAFGRPSPAAVGGIGSRETANDEGRVWMEWKERREGGCVEGGAKLILNITSSATKVKT